MARVAQFSGLNELYQRLLSANYKKYQSPPMTAVAFSKPDEPTYSLAQSVPFYCPTTLDTLWHITLDAPARALLARSHPFRNRPGAVSR